MIGVLVLAGAYLLVGDDDSSPDVADPTVPAGDDSFPDVPDPTVPGGDDGARPSSPSDGDEERVGRFPAGAEPEEVVSAYVEAGADGDCDTMLTLITDSMLAGRTPEDAVESCRDQAASDPDHLAAFTTLEIGNVEEDGETATVEGHGDHQGTALLLVFSLVRDGDSWLVDSIT